MPMPAVASDPPAGQASVLGVPVFVWVSNWRSDFTVTRNLAGVTVTVSATPQLLFASGEPGASTKRCIGPGRDFALGSGSIGAQAAAPDACTFAYDLRTGEAGRPSAWPGSVTVRWSIAWSASDGSGGTFPPVDRTAALPRPVVEVQTVVVPGG
jgi:hypothetical protein